MCAFMLLGQLVYNFFFLYLFIYKSIYVSFFFFPTPFYFREASSGPFESKTAWRLHSAFSIPFSKKLHFCMVLR